MGKPWEIYNDMQKLKMLNRLDPEMSTNYPVNFGKNEPKGLSKFLYFIHNHIARGYYGAFPSGMDFCLDLPKWGKDSKYSK